MSSEIMTINFRWGHEHSKDGLMMRAKGGYSARHRRLNPLRGFLASLTCTVARIVTATAHLSRRVRHRQGANYARRQSMRSQVRVPREFAVLSIEVDSQDVWV